MKNKRHETVHCVCTCICLLVYAHGYMHSLFSVCSRRRRVLAYKSKARCLTQLTLHLKTKRGLQGQGYAVVKPIFFASRALASLFLSEKQGYLRTVRPSEVLNVCGQSSLALCTLVCQSVSNMAKQAQARPTLDSHQTHGRAISNSHFLQRKGPQYNGSAFVR